tara:strand:+ start:267 stop:533 length:267 start_codon:yes stop_codon:yes gene_type:complete
MSTRSTISHSDDYHLYSEVFDLDNVWLELDTVVDASLSITELSKSGEDRELYRCLRMAIPVKVWRDIVKGWLESEWAKKPEWDCETNP